ncbi:hypothetical protein HDU99_005520, partial [Rhizoclosmatium hyalinum]
MFRLHVANATPLPPVEPVLVPATKIPVSKGYPFNGWTEPQKQLATKLKSEIQDEFIHLTGKPLAGEEEWASSDETIARYCKASKFDAAKALAMITKTLQWRRDFRPTEIKPEDVEMEARDGKMFYSGFDRMGRPILHFRNSQLSKNPDRYLKFIVFMVENGLALCQKGAMQITIVVEAEGISPFSIQSPMLYVKFLDILSSHYVETLGSLLLVDPSWYIPVIYNLVSGLIDPVTKAKINFILTKKKESKVEQVG